MSGGNSRDARRFRGVRPRQCTDQGKRSAWRMRGEPKPPRDDRRLLQSPLPNTSSSIQNLRRPLTDLVERFGFASRYNSVKRLVQTLRRVIPSHDVSLQREAPDPVSCPATETPRPRAAFGALRRLGVDRLRPCGLAGLPPALERRFIASP